MCTLDPKPLIFFLFLANFELVTCEAECLRKQLRYIVCCELVHFKGGARDTWQRVSGLVAKKKACRVSGLGFWGSGLMEGFRVYGAVRERV